MRSLYFLLLLFVCFGCSQNKTVIYQALAQDGVKPCKVGGYAPFQCGPGSYYTNTFEGMKNNQPVHGVVCTKMISGISIEYH